MSAWFLSGLLHLGVVLALASLTPVVNLGESCLPVVTNAPPVVLSVLSPALEAPAAAPDALAGPPVAEPPDFVPPCFAEDLEERFNAALATLVQPEGDLRLPPQLADELPSPTPPPPASTAVDHSPASSSDVNITADFALIRAHPSPTAGALASSSGDAGSGAGEAGSASDGAASPIGRGGPAGEGTGTGSGNGRGSGTGNGFGGAGEGGGRAGLAAAEEGDAHGNYGQATPPKPKRLDGAKYPIEAQKAGIQGTVVLSLEVLADGKVGGIAVAQSSGSHDLDRAASAAARRWTFAPAVADGHPIAAQIRVPIVFKLQ
ncbi:MAG: energy transducer TonB [Planctomycetota bacterium]